MDLTRQIDAYCERTGPGLWAEPLNAATNAAFIVAGLAALVLAARRGRLDRPAWFLGLTMLAIGAGSFLFHTVATAWAALLDTAPIGVFILGYFAIAMRRFAGLSRGRAALATLGFVAAWVPLAAMFRALAGGLIGSSTGYLPALAGLVAVALGLALRGGPCDRPAARGLLAAAGLFAVSLSLRALDRPLCDAWPAGTHFAWHLLNALVLFSLVRTLVRHGRRQASGRP